MVDGMGRRPDTTDVVMLAAMDADTMRIGNEDEMRVASSPLAPPTLEQFLDAIAKHAFRFAGAGLRNRDDALDAVQDTMIRMLIAAGPLRNERHGTQRWGGRAVRSARYSVEDSATGLTAGATSRSGHTVLASNSSSQSTASTPSSSSSDTKL